MNNENEIWKDIPDYEGYYQARNLGRIRSLDREVAYNDGRVRILKGKVMKPVMDRGGYLRIHISKEGKTRTFLVHRLVWMAFNGEIQEDFEVNHIDEDKTNNKLENLNLMTHTQNMNFGTRNERIAKAHINNPSKSKPVIAFDTDGNLAFEFPSTMEAERNGFNQGDLVSCCRGERRTHRGYRWRYKEENA